MLAKPQSEGQARAAAKLYMLLGISGLLLSLVVLGFLMISPGKDSSPTPVTEVKTVEPATPPTPRPATPPARQSSSTRPSGPAVAAPTAPTLPEPTAQSRHLVENLTKLDSAAGALTPEQIAAWKQNLQELIQQGATSVPAIREFLAKNMDLDFGAGGRGTLGYNSVRSAMFDALGQIGGPESISVLAGALSSTADPKEIALLALNLEKLEPSQHRQEVLAAAREALTMAGEGKLTDRDIAPIFEVFQKYGDASTASELSQNAKNWNYYSMIALAQLPDGAGIPSLIQVVEGRDSASSGSRAAALQMLAQTAATSEAAQAALLEQAKENKLTPYNWATLGPILAGDQIHFRDSAFDETLNAASSAEVQSSHIASGNQNFYTAPTPETLTVERLNQQAALIDQLMAATKDPTALQTLERSKSIVARRLAQITASQPK